MLGRSVGLSKEKVENLRLWKESTLYTEEERLALEYTEEVVKNIRISDELYSRLSSQFTAQQIINLCFTSGISGIINRIHGTFQTDVDNITLENNFVKESESALKDK